MAVIGLKCNSTPWPVLMLTVPVATYLLVLLLVTSSNLPSLQMMSASLLRKAPMPPISHLLSTSHPPLATKAESGEELPTEQKDTGPTYVTAINGILLPFLPATSFGQLHLRAPPLATLFQIGLPLFPREDSLAEALELPPLSMEHSFYMPVSAIRGLFSQLLTVPLYRQPNTLGWPYLDAPIDPGDQWSSDTFLLSAISSCSFLISCPLLFKNFYKLFRSTVHTSTISPPSPTSGKRASFRAPDLMTCPRSTIGPLNGNLGHRWIALSSPRSKVRMLKIGSCSASLLLAPNGHFSFSPSSPPSGASKVASPLFCVQGIFGSGKTYCASLRLVLVSTVLQLPTVLTAEPNLPLATAAETISDLLRDAPAESRAAYARVLAYGVPKLTPN